MHKLTKKRILLIILGLVVIGISLAAFFVDRDVLIEVIGIEHAYLILFIVSATAGVSIFTAAGFYAFFVAFIQSQVDPMIASIIAGVGVTFGDLIIFAFAHYAVRSSETIEQSKIYQRICAFVKKLPDWSVYILVFLYGAVIPIPNDILMAVLGALRYKFLPITIAMTLGNIILMILIAKGVMSVV